MIKAYIPNTVTCLNLLAGTIGVYHVLQGGEIAAIYFILIAGLFDFFDGFLARVLKVQSEIGKQLDSLADLVSFGLLPAVYMMQILRESDFYLIGASIVIFSALRLAIFNLDDSQTSSFKGLPTPANAIMLTSLAFSPIELYEYTFVVICLVSCVLLLSPIRLLALKFSSLGWKGNEARWILIVGSVGLFIAFKWNFLPILIPFYVVVSIITFVIFKEEKNF